jgi:hypothetical protein
LHRHSADGVTSLASGSCRLLLRAVCVRWPSADAAVWVPLALAMPHARWSGDAPFGFLLDAIFIIDVLIRFRLSYRDHGVPLGVDVM